ncbi:hypothetical protein V8E51_007258 [Hyaloscypha variabilis]
MMIPLSQLSPPGGQTSSGPTANLRIEEASDSERIYPPSSDDMGTRLPLSSNDVHGQASTLDNPINSPQQGPTSQESTSVLSPSTVVSSETARPMESKPAPPSQSAGSQAQPKPKSHWKAMNISFGHSHASTAPNISQPEEWKDDWLRPPRLAGLFLVTVSLIGTIPALCVLSRKRNGLVPVNDSTVTIVNYAVGPALAWTSFPVLLVTLYGMVLAAVVAASSTRQPYVELFAQSTGNGAGLDQSILLDYNFYSPLRQPWIALKNKHLLLAVAITFTSIVNVLLPSLTAHLFDPTIVNTNMSRVVTQNTTFNPAGFTFRTDLVPIFDIVSSTLVYGGMSPAWTTFNYSMLNFSNPSIPKGNIGSNKFSVETMAYSANLDCVVLDGTQYNLTFNGQGFQFQGFDRGCSLTGDLLIGGLGSQNFTYYIQSFANVDCDVDAGESRLAVLAAANSNGSLTTLTNITAISCVTAYFNTSGTLSITLDSTSSAIPKIQNFTPISTALIDNPRPEFWQDFETLLHEASINDGTATISATDFGRLVLEYARTIEPQAYLGSNVLLSSTEAIFTAVYAVMAQTFLLQPTAAVGITGTLSISTTRLLVVTPIAYAITGILCAVCLILVWIFSYVRTHKSILYEEPKGLLGSAAILSKSGLESEVNQIRTNMPSNTTAGKIVEMVEKEEKFKELRQRGWRIENWDKPQQSCIVMTPKARLPQWKSTFQRNH